MAIVQKKIFKYTISNAIVISDESDGEESSSSEIPGNDSHLSPDASSLCSSIDEGDYVDLEVNSASVPPHGTQKAFDYV